MKSSLFTCILASASLVSCEKKSGVTSADATDRPLNTSSVSSLQEGIVSPQSTPETTHPVMIDRTIPPGSQRARAAAENTRSALERDLAGKGLKFGDPVFIRAFKEEEELEIFVRNRETGKYDLFRTYPIAALSGVSGPKLAEGDGQVPEGFYFVPPEAMNPSSQFHLSFNIGYPNDYDRAHGRTGTAIMIHGNRVSIGCLAMTDEKIEEIYTLCDSAHREGQPFFRVHIFPFRMDPARMLVSSAKPNGEFWQNLAEGYGIFERTRIPPEVTVTAGRYLFSENVK